MKRTARLALVLGLLATCPPPTVAEEPAKAPVTDEVWNARDFEGRWILFRNSPGSASGTLTTEWVPFLERHGEWNLLEWSALAVQGIEAMRALEKNARTTWARVAVWSLDVGDTHLNGAARELLRNPKHAPVVRAWLARYPQSALGPEAAAFAQALANVGTGRDEAGAAALAGPYVLDRLLAALDPPAKVVPFGARLHAEPGVTYLHQVERALDILANSGLRGEPWTTRLGKLLAHPVQAVRRAAALAAASRPAEGIPLEALLERLGAAEEHPEVRSAALLGLSSSPDPAARTLILGIASDPRHPAFTAAVSRLADIDDGFALELWRDLDATPAGPTAPAFLAGERKRLAERLAARDANGLARAVPRMLDLAAFVDVGCHPLESTLVPWTRETIGTWTAMRQVRQALETLVQQAAAPTEPGAQPGGSRAERVRRYARDILAKPPEPQRAR